MQQARIENQQLFVANSVDLQPLTKLVQQVDAKLDHSRREAQQLSADAAANLKPVMKNIQQTESKVDNAALQHAEAVQKLLSCLQKVSFLYVLHMFVQTCVDAL